MAGTIRLGHRAWARLERCARRGHERDLEQQLRDLATAGTPVLARHCSRHGLGAVRLVTTTHHVVLAGLSERALAIVDAVGADATMVDSGRYRHAWWLTLDDGSQLRHVLGAYLRIVPSDGRDSGAPATDLPHARSLSRVH